MEFIEIVEVGPRDGFQNIETYIPIETKLEIINGLIDAGLRSIQITSFVSPKAIPQLKDAKEVSRAVLKYHPEQSYNFSALVPNLFGASVANENGIKNIEYVISLSESHNKANIGLTHEQSLNILADIINNLPNLNMSVVLATTFGCPFEGKFNTDTIIEFINLLDLLEIKEIVLADTIGIANPKEVREVIYACKNTFPHIEFSVHIHDTRNMGIACTLAAIESGITKVQSSLGGLGGCPFAPGASGNIATEDLVYMLHAMGYETGIDFEKLWKLAKTERQKIEGNYSSHHINIF